MFAAFDLWHFRSEPVDRRVAPPEPVRIRGLVNVVLIAAIIGCILLSAKWRPGVAVDVFGTRLELQNLVRDGLLVAIALLSLWWTQDEHREANGFTWEPIREVAKLFAGIFIVIIPVLAVLDAGPRGFFAWLLSAVTEPDGTPHEVAYFWYTGLMSAFLDNAPTYLLFFKLAGGDAQRIDGRAFGDAGGDLDGRRLYGSADLYRERAEFHGRCDRGRKRHQDAEFLRLSVAGRRHPGAPVPAADLPAGCACIQAALNALVRFDIVRRDLETLK